MGGVTTAIVNASAKIGSNILDDIKKPTPVYTAHTLQGWAYDAEGLNIVGATDNITDGLKVYAVWESTT